MASKYYYLIAGFPELNLEFAARGFDHLALKQQVSNLLKINDLPLWEAMYLPYDNHNLLNLLLKRSASFSSLGKFTQEELEEVVQQPVNAPQYMRSFIEAFHAAREAKDESELTDVALETKLYTYFYAYVESLNSKFLSRWYAFDRRLRNVQAALLNRRLNKEVGYGLVGSDNVTEALGKSLAADFGLKGEIDGLDLIIQLFDNKDIINRERKLDELRWQMVEEYTAFDYFTLDKVLSYAVQLQLIDRWKTMGKELGQQQLQQLLGEIHSSFDLEKTLT